MEHSEKWEPVDDIDYSKRKPQEWAKIYNIELVTNIDDGRIWSEYEWAYHMFNADYRPLYVTGKEFDFEKFDQMELRALYLRRDVFYGASAGEKESLNTKYVETEWCRRRLSMV